MNATQIVFVQLPSVAHVEQWRAHNLGILSAAGPEPRAVGTGPRVVWQLTSANHRALARSVRAFEDFEAAYANATAVRERASELVIRQVKLDRQLGYGWTGMLDGIPVAMCSRAYSTVRDNRDSSAAALTAIALARIGGAPRARTGTGRRA